jgi:integrase
MPKKISFPTYKLHKASGLARVILDGKHVYLGPYGSEKSHAEYAKLLAERFGNFGPGPQNSTTGDRFPDLSVNELLVRFLKHAGDYYSRDGKPTKEYVAMRDAVVPLRTLFSHTAARDIGPLRLKAVQTLLVNEGRKCRREINKQINRIRRVFSWAVGEELIPPAVHLALTKLATLKRGRTEAREAPRVKPVADVVVEATLPFLSPTVAAMVRVQRLSGARPGEVTIMRSADIDMSGEIWLYRPTDHKNAWREQPRVIALGPQAQTVLAPFLNRPSDAFLFSPREAEAWRNEQRVVNRKADRKTPIYPSELRARERRKELARSRESKRTKRDHYDVDAYRRAITYGIRQINRLRAKQVPPVAPLPSWHPYQLRHAAATELRRRFGIEAVPVGLGNSADLAELYAERDMDRLKEIASMLG